MSFNKTYTINKIDSKQLAGEVESSLTWKLLVKIAGQNVDGHIEVAGNSMTIGLYSITPTSQEIATLDNIVLLSNPDSLEQVKGRLASSVINWRNTKTEGLLYVEHPDSSGNKFSVNFISQQKWLALENIKDNSELVSYPYSVRVNDDRDSYDIVDATDVSAIFNKVVRTVKSEIDLCRDSIDNIMKSIDESSAQIAHDAYYGT